MTVGTQGISAGIIAALVLAGCLGAAPGQNSGPDGPDAFAGWEYVDGATTLELGFANLTPDRDWLLMELVPENVDIMTIRINGTWDFENPAVDPPLTEVCSLISAGSEHGSAYGAPPMLVGGRVQPGLPGFAAEPGLAVRASGLTLSSQVRTLGTGYWVQNLLIGALSPDQPFYVAFGLDAWDEWEAQGAEFSIRLEVDTAFHYQIVHRGDMQCRSGLTEYERGDVVRTPAGTVATGLATDLKTQEGFTGWFHVSGNVEREIAVTSPDGAVAYQNASQTINPIGPLAETVTVCGEATGAWNVEFPTLRGTDHRWVWADSLLLDVPAELQTVFPCNEN